MLQKIKSLFSKSAARDCELRKLSRNLENNMAKRAALDAEENLILCRHATLSQQALDYSIVGRRTRGY